MLIRIKQAKFRKFRKGDSIFEDRRFSNCCLDKELLFFKFLLDKELLLSKFGLDKELLFSKFRLDKGGQRDQIEDEVCEGEGGREGEVDGYVGPGFEHLVQLDAGVAVSLHKVVCTVQVPKQ